MRFFAALPQDVRWSLHVMRRNLGLTAAVVASLGLAIGANTAIFSVVDAFLLRPLAIEKIDRIVRLRENLAERGGSADLRSLSGAAYRRWSAEQKVFTGIAAASGTSLTLTGSGEPERFSASAVTANFFPVLGIRPLLGRSFAPEEDRPGRDQVVMIGYDVWRSRFGGDPRILERTLLLNGRRCAVVGVLPRGFHHPYQSHMWVPLAYRDDAAHAGQEYYAPARLKPGVTLAQARRQMDEMVRRLHEADPRPRSARGADLSPLRRETVGDLERLLDLLAAAAAFVLLIACVNTSTLLLAQGLKQDHEVAVRAALGASRRRLVQQILTYSALLALLGGALGLLLAHGAMRPLVALSPTYGLGEFDIEPRLDLATLAFGLAASLAVGIVFGLVPALRMSRRTLGRSLQEGGRTRTAGVAGRRLLGGLVVAEVALAMVLLAGAGLIVRSFERLRGEDRGFRTQGVLSFQVPFPDFKFPQRRQKVEFVRRALDRLRRVPGIAAVGATTVQPLFAGTSAAGLSVEGRPVAGERGDHLVHDRTITPGYLESLGAPLVAGRFPDDRDVATAPWVVVLSKTAADRYWPGESAVGKRLKRGLATSSRPWLTVVGVVGAFKETHDDLLANDDAWYLPYAQPIVEGLDEMTFTASVRGDPAALAPAVRRALREVDPEEPVYGMLTMDERLTERTTPERFSAVTYTAFGLLGLLLAAIGIHGVLAFNVSQRLREMGIRAAVGAEPGDLRRLVLRSALRMATAGLAIGLAGALFLTRLLASQLHEVSPRDPLVLAAALASLAVVTLVAGYVPARRASRVDPAIALRTE